MNIENKTLPGFCPKCGDILPFMNISDSIKCYKCPNTQYKAEVFGDMYTEYTINFNTVVKKSKTKIIDNEKQNEGPLVDRRCSKCNNSKMSYATLQLRSADEGQTVFYTCIKCGFKETENT